LLHRIWQTWHQSEYEKDRPRSFVFMPRRNPVEEAVLAKWGVTMITAASDNPEEALATFLGDLREKTAASAPA
jgi:hypothetical protein